MAPAGRSRGGPTLFLRIFLQLLLSALAALALNLVFLLASPPPSLPIHRLSEVRAALASGRDPSGQLVVAIGEPPAQRADEPWVDVQRRRLAAALGAPPELVRLAVLRQWPLGRRLVPFLPFVHHRRQIRGDPRADLVIGRFIAAVHLPDGQWRIVTSADRGYVMWLRQMGLSLLAIAIAMTPAAWLLARRLTAPVRIFAAAAERLGRDPRAPPLPVQGPPEVAAATEALNEMQRRLHDYVDDRTTMIAAIAHDLRTPLMRLAFHLEALPPNARVTLEPDIAEMKAMISSALAYARETSAHDERQRLDLRSLIESLADGMTDQGHDVAMLPGADPVVDGDALALRALFANLLENAVRYGTRARVALSAADGAARVTIDDDGPGLDEGELERVFQPFYRAERSRSRDTGGTGLGLAIVRAIVKGHAGDVFVANRPGGGLRATVRLPLSA
jgi:two-component system OmpR family sensor kinase